MYKVRVNDIVKRLKRFKNCSYIGGWPLTFSSMWRINKRSFKV